MLIICIVISAVLGKQSPNKRYSIPYGSKSTINMPLDDVFHIEIKQQDIENITNLHVPHYADFCTVNNPSLYLEQVRSLQVCTSKCLLEMRDEMIYALINDGYLQFSQLYEDLTKIFYSEILVPLGNIDNTIMTFNQLNSSRILINENANFTFIDLHFSNSKFDKKVITHQLPIEEYNISFDCDQSQKQIPQHNQIHYFNDYVYLFSGGILRILQLQDKLIKQACVNLNKLVIKHLNIKTNEEVYITSLIPLNNNEFLAQSNSILYSLAINLENQSIQVSQILALEGNITLINAFDDYLYVVYNIGHKLNSEQYLLEYLNYELQQNITLSSPVTQLFSTKTYIMALQNNIIQIAFARVTAQQLFSKSILEGTDSIQACQNSTLVIRQGENITTQEIKQQKAELICQPLLSDTTGLYSVYLSVGQYVNGSKIEYNMTIELNVYREIFENGNLGLYAGLAVGLSLTFIIAIIFCVSFYKIKSKYQALNDIKSSRDTE